jgi:O-antigen ligase
VPAWRWREAALLLTAFEFSFGHALFGCVVLLVVAIAEVIEGEPLWVRSPIDLGLAALLGAAVLSALVSPWRSTALTVAAATAVIVGPPTRAAVLAVRRRPAFAQAILWAWAAGAVAAAAWALGGLDRTPDARAVLPDLTPNGLGTTLAVGMVILTGLLLDTRGLVRALAGVGLPVVALGLALTWSRGGWLAAATGMVVLLALRPSRRLWWGWLAAGATIAVAIPLLGARWAWHLDRLRDLLPAEGPFSRLAVWRVAVRAIGEHPLVGTGLGTFASVYDRSLGWVDGPAYAPSAHNLLLHVAAETGILGVAALVALIAGGGVALARWYRRDPATSPQRTMASIALASSAAFLAHQMVDVTIIALSVSVGLFLLFGIGAGASAAEPGHAP